MRKTKTILFMALAICLMLPASIILSACGDRPKDNDINITLQDKVYDGTAFSLTAEAVSHDEVTLEYKVAGADDSTYTATAPKDVGSYIVRAKVAKTNEYNEFEITATFNITPKEVEAEWTAPVNLVYSKEAKVPGFAITGGVIAGDECNINLALNADNDNVNVGEFTYTASLDNANYKIKDADASRSYTITPKELTVEWTAPINLVYNTEAKMPAIAITGGIVAGDECEISAVLNADNDNVNAGTFACTATLDNANYKVNAEDLERSYTITKATYSTIRYRYKLEGEENWRAYGNEFVFGDVVLFGVACDGGEAIEGEVTYSEYIYPDQTTGALSVVDNVVTATKYGVVYVEAEVAESRNYYSKGANGVLRLEFDGLTPVEGEQYILPVDVTAVYGQTLEDAVLPAGYAWVDTSTSVGNVGTNNFSATFTPSGDDANIYKPKTVTIGVAVEAKEIEIEWTAPANLTYTKTAKVPTVVITGPLVGADECDINATLKAGNDNINVGTFAYVAVLTNNNYKIAEVDKEQSYTIVPATVSVSWTAPANLTYNGEAKVPTVELTSGVLVGDECEISAALKADNDNVNAGQFTYVAVATNPNYTVTYDSERTYTISKAYHSYLRVRYRKQGTEEWSGLGINVHDNVELEAYNDGGEDLEGEVTFFEYNFHDGSTTGEMTINGNIATGTKCGHVFVMATVAASRNYYSYTTAGAIRIHFAGLEPVEGEQYTLPTGLTATYGDQIKDIELPEGFVWYNPNNYVGSAGTRSFSAKFVPQGDDAIEYEIKDVSISVEVLKATPEFVAPENLEIPYGTWLAGTTGLPAGYYWSGSHDAGEIGEHSLAGTYNPNISNYNTVNGTITYTVVKANPDYEAPTGLVAKYGQFVSEIALPAGFSWHTSGTPVGFVGTNNHLVDYTPADTTHYNVVLNIPVQIEVSKGDQVISTSHDSKVFDGDPITVEDLGLSYLGDGDVTIEYKLSTDDDEAYSTVAPNAAHTYSVRITVDESDYYESGVKVVTFSIVMPD